MDVNALDNPHTAALRGCGGGARWWSTVGHPARECRDIRLLARGSQASALRPVTKDHQSYGVDSTTRRFCANGIMKVFFNDCQASNPEVISTTQR